ncbi:MAG: hypothetical protein LBQ84_08585 [Flavobacteriaceae bacterium]|jgi:hypothetical protein|nr:hypothetical protein [Flavobacteriaceae bacterium]
MRKSKYTVIIFLMACMNVFAKGDSLLYDRSKIYPRTLPEKPSEIYTGKDFVYEEPIQQPNILTRFLTWIYNKFIDFLNELFDFNLRADTVSGRQVLWYILIFLSLILISIGIVFFYKKFKRSLGRNDKDDLSAEEVEKNINTVNFDKLIQNAVKEQDYRLAIRFYYLKLLKLMTNQQLINYEYQKTNYEYFYEIKNLQLKDLFKEVSFVFDYCWYGDHRAGESDFNMAKNKFSEVQQLISNL